MPTSQVKAGAPLTVYNCLMMAMPGPDGKVGALTCQLPGNANPGPGLQPLINQAGRSYCAVDRARYLGATSDQDIYEVACKNGTGLVLANKRLEQGSFRWPTLREGVMRLTPAQLAALLEGLDWARVRGARTATPTAVS